MRSDCWPLGGCRSHARDFNPRSPNGKRPVKMDSLSHNAGTIVHSRHRSYRKPLLTLQIPSGRLQTPHNIHYEVIKQPEEQRRPSSSCHFAVRKDEYSIEALRRHQSHDIISDVHLLPCLQCLSEHHHPINRHVSLSAAMLDLRSILRTQIVIAQTVALLIFQQHKQARAITKSLPHKWRISIQITTNSTIQQ